MPLNRSCHYSLEILTSLLESRLLTICLCFSDACLSSTCGGMKQVHSASYKISFVAFTKMYKIDGKTWWPVLRPYALPTLYSRQQAASNPSTIRPTLAVRTNKKIDCRVRGLAGVLGHPRFVHSLATSPRTFCFTLVLISTTYNVAFSISTTAVTGSAVCYRINQVD